MLRHLKVTTHVTHSHNRESYCAYETNVDEFLNDVLAYPARKCRSARLTP